MIAKKKNQPPTSANMPSAARFQAPSNRVRKCILRSPTYSAIVNPRAVEQCFIKTIATVDDKRDATLLEMLWCKFAKFCVVRCEDHRFGAGEGVFETPDGS